MANNTIPMQKLRDIIQLHVKGYSYRKIAKITGVHRAVVTNYIVCVKDYPPAEALALPDQAFYDLFKKPQEQTPLSQKQYWLNDFLLYAAKEIKKKHVTRQLVYAEYQEKHTDVFSYSHFCELLGRSLEKSDYSLFQIFSPGEIIMADFAGDKLFVTDKETGEETPCEVLIITLGYSGYTFVIALLNQTQECFVEGLNQAVLYFGGSSKIMRIDNLKSGVIKADRYEPTFNALLLMFCQYYNIVPDATRARKPKDKAQVESHVRIVYQRIYAPLRNNVHHSIKELNHAVLDLLEAHNKRPYKGTAKSRADFYEEERALLQPLPAHPFTHKNTKKATVQKNYHVWLGHDEHYYSVPYQYVGNTVNLIYDHQIMEIYYEYSRIALHPRMHKIGRYSTIDQHMPEAHTVVKNGTDLLKLKEQAGYIGEHTLQFVETLLNKGLLTPQHFKSCQGLLSLVKKYPKERINNACKRAVEHKSITYKAVERILEMNLDTTTAQEQQTSLPFNPTTRGNFK